MFIASIASIATPLGCFLSGPISDKFGRKTAIIWINIVGLIGWILIAVAFYCPTNQYVILLIGRIITGLSTGLASMPASVYMAEVSCSKLRSVFTTWNAIFFSFGILVVYALGYCLKNNWGTVAIITAILPTVGLLTIWLLIPESPTWLISKNRMEEAHINLCKIYGVPTHNITVLEEIQSLVNYKTNDKTNITYDNKTCLSQLKQLLQPSCLKPFVLVLTYFFFQQFSGSFVVVFYAIDIVKDAGVTMDPYSAIVTVAITRFFSSILVSFLSKKYGRRPLSIVSGAGMTICMISLAIYLFLAYKNTWLPIVLLIVYFFTSTLGFLTMPFAMAAECFPGEVRGTATGLITCIAYIFNFITVKLFPNMVETMKSEGVFCFYGGMALVGTIFIVVFLPETKGKTLQEIEEYFSRKKQCVLNEISSDKN